jgi:MFS family permease
MSRAARPPVHEVESRYAWTRMLCSLALMTLGGVGMYGVTVVLPLVQQEFEVSRGIASLPYTLTMVGYGLGAVLMGRIADRHGVMVPVLAGAFCLAIGYALAASAQSFVVFALAQGVLIGLLGTSTTFAPLVADTSMWFTRRRGIAVSIVACGNYAAGTLWPPVLQHFFDSVGWRTTFYGIAAFCFVAMIPLALVLRPRPPLLAATGTTDAPVRRGHAPVDTRRPLGFSPAMLQALLCVAGTATCVAMSMPQVHIVAYCGDLGFGAARGAQMLSLMLGCGILSRLASGWLSDRIGGLRTLLINSALQAFALVLFFSFDSLASLYVISALFGLFQGGIIPSYAIIVREHFPPGQAGSRVGVVLMATLFGMALGGWMSGAIFDLTGSYDAAFANGIGWNILNLLIVLELLRRSRRLGRGAGRGNPATHGAHPA